MREPNGSNVARHLIDDLPHGAIATDHSHVLCCWMSDSARRYSALGSWLEVDTTPVLSRKEAALPTPQDPNPLEHAPGGAP
jgi:hypothetical protein